jgi:hypothetical protein
MPAVKHEREGTSQRRTAAADPSPTVPATAFPPDRATTEFTPPPNESGVEKTPVERSVRLTHSRPLSVPTSSVLPLHNEALILVPARPRPGRDVQPAPDSPEDTKISEPDVPATASASEDRPGAKTEQPLPSSGCTELTVPPVAPGAETTAVALILREYKQGGLPKPPQGTQPAT